MNAEVNVLLMVLKHRRVLLGELQATTGYTRDVLLSVLQNQGDAVAVRGEEVLVVNPMLVALKLLGMRVEPRKIGELLSWRDFEEFSSRVLRESGYEVLHGLKITSPVRFEIDVFGVEPYTGFSVAIDCKQWSSRSPSKLLEATAKHAERVKKMINHYPIVRSRYKLVEKARQVVPLIVTLLTPPIRVHNGVLVLSIGELPRFTVDRHAVLDYFEIKPLELPSSNKL